MSLNLALMLWKQPNIYVQKVKVEFITEQYPHDSQNFVLSYKNLDDQTKSDRTNTVNSKTVLQAIETNSESIRQA